MLKMQVVNKIDQLITRLNKLKPELLDGIEGGDHKFYQLLQSTINSDPTHNKAAMKLDVTPELNSANEIPSWVDPNYYYDPNSPRKPNMLELMEAISGKSLDDLYKEPKSSWKKVSSEASEMLYGVVGSNEDSRDWLTIMASDDILKSAREQTGKMHEPAVDIVPSFANQAISSEKIAIIKDKNGNTLRSLSNNISSTEEILRNFGATSDSIPSDLELKIGADKFDKGLLNFLKNFDKNPSSIEKIMLQSTAEIISGKLSNNITLEEFAKL